MCIRDRNKITGAYGYRIKRSTDEDGTYKVVKTIKSGNRCV